MGVARKLKICRATNFRCCEKGAEVANALDIFAGEIRTSGGPSQDSINLITQEFIAMLCLPLCATTFISPDALSEAVASVPSTTEGVPESVVEDLVHDMYCNLCPPWPLCPGTLSQCINKHFKTVLPT